jgi:hypothetical protein
MPQESRRIIPDIRHPMWTTLEQIPTGIGLGLRPWPLTHPRTGFRGRVMRLQEAHRLTRRRRIVPLLRSTLQSLQLLEGVWETLRKERMHQGTDITVRGRRVGDPPPCRLLGSSSSQAPPRGNGCARLHIVRWRAVPKRRIAETDVGASKWTLEEWRMLLTTGDASDSKESSEDDGKPQIRANPSKPKAQWSAADMQRSIACSLRILQNRKKEAPFRALKLPDSRLARDRGHERQGLGR